MNDKILCDFCEAGRLLLVRGSISAKYNGDLIEIPSIEFLQCEYCGEKKFLPHQEEEKQRLIEVGYRKLHNLLTPSEIRTLRKSFDLTQDELASVIGCGKTSLSRWENGNQVQSRMVDNFLRLLKNDPEAVNSLKLESLKFKVKN